jgi:hypothetical protein
MDFRASPRASNRSILRVALAFLVGIPPSFAVFSLALRRNSRDRHIVCCNRQVSRTTNDRLKILIDNKDKYR